MFDVFAWLGMQRVWLHSESLWINEYLCSQTSMNVEPTMEAVLRAAPTLMEVTSALVQLAISWTLMGTHAMVRSHTYTSIPLCVLQNSITAALLSVAACFTEYFSHWALVDWQTLFVGSLVTDVNECNTNNGSCAQNCTNTVGSYYCTCGTGYTLNSDNHACNGMIFCII